MNGRHLACGAMLVALGAASLDAAPQKSTMKKRLRMAQAAPGAPALGTAPAQAESMRDRPVLATGPVTIAREAEPLMLRALAAYYVTDEMMFRDLRSRGWSFGDMATAGNLAARSDRSLQEVANAYDDRRNWTDVARQMNVPADDIYVAINAPHLGMTRPSLDAHGAMARHHSSGAATTPGTVTPTAPAAVAAVPSSLPSATTTPQSTTSVERVASARLEMTPREPDYLLRRAVATYYAVPVGTVRELEANGWTLGDVLIAGNIAHRSEASFDEVVAVRGETGNWNQVSDRVGFDEQHLYHPTRLRRVAAVPDRAVGKTREKEERLREARERQDWEWKRATHHGAWAGEMEFRGDPHRWNLTEEEEQREADRRLLREQSEAEQKDRELQERRDRDARDRSERREGEERERRAPTMRDRERSESDREQNRERPN